MEILSLSQLDLNKTYSYADYYAWMFEERVELLKGKVMQIIPTPNRAHQTLSREIGIRIINFLSNSPSQVFYAPFDVRLERNNDDNKVFSVLQPDICVICDLTKLDDRGCSGAPDLIVEILSPGNSKKEMKYKFELYEAAGVLEYWIVDPIQKMVLQYILKDNSFVNYHPLTEDDTLKSYVLDGLEIDLKEVFGNI
jgi:Uma2 family endonuclease